jgi:hypothetical protein
VDKNRPPLHYTLLGILGTMKTAELILTAIRLYSICLMLIIAPNLKKETNKQRKNRTE